MLRHPEAPTSNKVRDDQVTPFNHHLLRCTEWLLLRHRSTQRQTFRHILEGRFPIVHPGAIVEDIRVKLTWLRRNIPGRLGRVVLLWPERLTSLVFSEKEHFSQAKAKECQHLHSLRHLSLQQY